jgi:succinate dehydrogenase/fumarate reductase-like Fe-S protein
MELRCEGNILHALVIEEDEQKPQGVIEFRCRSKFCGKSSNQVVLHRFDLETGECHTRRYKDPHQQRGE